MAYRLPRYTVPHPGAPRPASSAQRPGLPGLLVRLLAVTLLCTLAACSTPEERAARAEADVQQMMVVYGPACTRLGYAAQSDAWRNCVVNLSTRDELQRYGRYPDHYYGGWGPGYWRGGWWGSYW